MKGGFEYDRQDGNPDAGAYIVVGIAAFVVGVAQTLICIRLKKKKTNRTEDAGESEEQTWENEYSASC